MLLKGGGREDKHLSPRMSRKKGRPLGQGQLGLRVERGATLRRCAVGWQRARRGSVQMGEAVKGATGVEELEIT